MKLIYSLTLLLSVSLMACSDDEGGNVTVKGAGTSTLAVVNRKAVDPTTMNIKVYQFWVSEDASCTGTFTKVYDNSSPTFTNLLSNPTFGSGSLADGSYGCVAMVISDNLQFVPASTEGDCSAGTTYTLDVCRADGGGQTSSILPDGTTTTCTGTNSGGTQVLGDDKVAVYLSTSGSSSNSVFIPTSPLPLTAAFTVSGTAVATFIVDGTGKVESNSGQCDMQPPSFGFSAQ